MSFLSPLTYYMFSGPSATNLATSRVKRCTFTYTKGGQSIERGGGQASDIIRRFEERKEKTDINIAHGSDSYWSLI